MYIKFAYNVTPNEEVEKERRGIDMHYMVKAQRIGSVRGEVCRVRKPVQVDLICKLVSCLFLLSIPVHPSAFKRSYPGSYLSILLWKVDSRGFLKNNFHAFMKIAVSPFLSNRKQDIISIRLRKKTRMH